MAGDAKGEIADARRGFVGVGFEGAEGLERKACGTDEDGFRSGFDAVDFREDGFEGGVGVGVEEPGPQHGFAGCGEADRREVEEHRAASHVVTSYVRGWLR